MLFRIILPVLDRKEIQIPFIYIHIVAGNAEWVHGGIA